MIDFVSLDGKCPTCGEGSKPQQPNRPFARCIRVRAVLLADANEWVIFGSDSRTDVEMYKELLGEYWIENFHDAAVIVEFDIDVETRSIVVKNPVAKTNALKVQS